MKALGETVVLATLAVAAAGLYASGAFDSPEVFSAEPAIAEPAEEEPFVLKAPEAPTIPSKVVSTDLSEDRGDWRGQPSVADLDGDGNLDLVASIRRWSSSESADGMRVWLGDGAGGFQLAIDGIRRDMGYGGADTGDIDGDGLLDVAFSGHDTPPQAFLNQGDGTWRESSDGLVSQGVSVDVALGDFDGDGKTDLATLGMFPGDGGLLVFQGDGAGGWELREEFLDVEEFGNALLATDIEGDGRLELVAATSTGIRVWSHDGTAFVDRSEGLAPPAFDAEQDSYISGSDLDVLAYDFDGDGIQELLAFGMMYPGHEPVRGFKLDEHGVWRPWGSGFPQDEAVFDAELAQIDTTDAVLDSDGRNPPELVLACKFGVKIVSMQAPGEFVLEGRVAGTDGVVNVTAGDFDSDGRDEIVFIGFGGIRVLKPSLRGDIQ